MIYRILTGVEDEFWSASREAIVRRPLPMMGAGSTLAGATWELHLPAPEITNERARFWFTEGGWDRFGRALVSEGRQRGYVVKVIRRKNPRGSQIVYEDEWQVALLPDKRPAR